MAESNGGKVGKKYRLKRISGWAWVSMFLAVIATVTTIGWLNSYPPMATEWAVVSNLVTAFGTLGLAIFAVLAWLSSGRTLKTMRKQIRAQTKDTSRQIKHSRHLAEKARQTEALASLIISLGRVRAAILSSPESVLSIVTEMEILSKIWQMQSRIESTAMRLTDSTVSLLAEIVRTEEGPLQKLDGENHRGRLQLEKAARDLAQSLYQGNEKAFHEEKAERELLRILEMITEAYPHVGARIQPDGSVGFWRLLSKGEGSGVEISERQSLPGNEPTDGLPGWPISQPETSTRS